MSSEDLESVAEQSLMAAQEALHRMHMSSQDSLFFLDRAVVNSRQAADALEILHQRIFS
jgi:hypothetical protein